MPKITKTLFAGSFLFTLAAHFGLLSPWSLILDWQMIWHKFHIWRLGTSFFYCGKVGFPFLINLYFLYSYSLRMETELFERRPADYITMLLVCWFVALTIAYFMGLMIIGQIITMAIMYTWAQCNKDVVVSFYFGTKFPAMYLPWALLMFNILLGGNGMTELMGIVTGHVYFFFKFAYPRDLGGTAWLETPAFLKSYFPEEGAGRAGLNGAFGEAPASRQQNAPPPRTAWGRGRTLGDN